MSEQAEFLFADGAEPELHLAHPMDDLFRAIESAWALPLGQRVRVTLRDASVPPLEGKLELVRSPDLPLNPKEVLALRLRGLNFTSRDIAAWSLLE